MGDLVFGLPATLAAIDISDIINSFEHDKSNSISQLINEKSRDLQKLFQYFNGTTTSASNILLLFGVLPIILSYIEKIYLLFFC